MSKSKEFTEVKNWELGVVSRRTSERYVDRLGGTKIVGNKVSRGNFSSQPTTIHSQLGFTLLEVMVALAVMAATLVMVGSLRNRDAVYHDEVRQIITATLLAQERMTTLEMEDDIPGYGETSGGFESPYDRYTWVQIVSPTLLEIVREIRFQIRWGERAHEAVEIVSYILDEEDQGS